GPFLLYARGGEGAMELGFEFADQEVRLQASLRGPMPEDILHPGSSPAIGEWAFQFVHRPSGSDNGGWTPVGDAALLVRALPAAVSLRLDAHRLASPSYIPSTKPQMQPDGNGLPSVLAHLKTYREEEFEKLQRFLQSVIPAVQRIRTDRAAIPL